MQATMSLVLMIMRKKIVIPATMISLRSSSLIRTEQPRGCHPDCPISLWYLRSKNDTALAKREYWHGNEMTAKIQMAETI